MNRKWIAVIVVAVVALLAIQKWRERQLAREGLSQAIDLARRGGFASARGLLRRYIAVRPDDYEASIWLAETLIKDESIDARKSAEEALGILRGIPESSPLAAAALCKIGSIELLICHRPGAAEKALLQSVALRPEHPEPRYLLWRLLDLTGRSNDAEPHMWVVLDDADPPTKLVRLREWYMSQFFPATATLELDRLMGVPMAEEAQPANAELTRFLTYQQTEPDSPLGYVAEARWMVGSGNPKAGLQALEACLQTAPDAARNRGFVSAMVATMMELGYYDRAKSWFEKWPEPRGGYDYLKLKAIILDEVDGDPAAAAPLYQEALLLWPGPVDWRTRTRLAHCFAQTRNPQAAEAQRAEAKRLETLMHEGVQRLLREVMGQLDNPYALRPIYEFYEQIGRPREAEAWRQAVAANAPHPQPLAETPESGP